MKIEILSHKAVEKLSENESLLNVAVIFIDNCGESKKHIKCKRCLFLYFNDTIDRHHPYSMKRDDARKIKEFVLSLGKDIEKLIVSCTAAVSRSASVAAGVMKGLGRSDMIIWKNANYSPNILCYKLVLKAFGKSTLFADFKNKQNKYAFRQQIKVNR